MNRSLYALFSLFIGLLFVGLLVETTQSSNAGYAAELSATSNVYLPMVSNDLPPIIPETTEVLTEESTQHLVAVSSDGATFTFNQMTPELSNLNPGDVMVGNVSEAAPAGFLRTVVSVSAIGEQIIVATAPATLEDAIQQGSIRLSKRLTSADLDSVILSEGVMLETRPGEPELNDAFIFELKDVIVYDKDGDLKTTNDQIKAKGSLELAPDFDFNLTIKDHTLEELDFIIRVEEAVALEIGAEVSKPLLDVSILIGKIPLGEIIAFVGPVPVVILVEMPVYLKIEGEAKAGVWAKVTQTADLTAGLQYRDGQWYPVSNLINDFSFDPPTGQIGAEFKAFIDPPLGLLLYGVAGPFASANPYVKLIGEVSGLSTDWKLELHGGITATVGVQAEILGHSLGNYVKEVIKWDNLLWSLSSNNPPYEPANPFPVDQATNQVIDRVLTWTGGDPDGGTVTYDVYLEADDSTPDILVAAGQLDTLYDPGTLLPQTQYYWQIVAEDGQGAITEGPIWQFSTESGLALILATPQLNDFTVTVDGVVTTTNGTITQLHWQWGDGHSDDQWFPASHTYALTGTFPITATAYDDLGHSTWQTTTITIGNSVPVRSTALISLADDETLGNNMSTSPAVSADGRYVVFVSRASNLVLNDTNGVDDIFVRDTQMGTTTRVSVSSSGTQSNGTSSRPDISADGRYVVFLSTADNLVAGDTNGLVDVFVHDLTTGDTIGISKNPGSEQLDGATAAVTPSISGDGHYVAYTSGLSPYYYIYIRDLLDQTTSAVGSPAYSSLDLSADGHYLAFDSRADIVAEDNNSEDDVYVYDRTTTDLTLASVKSDGTIGNFNSSGGVSISSDGRYVAFVSFATNLTGEATSDFDTDILVHDRQTGTTFAVSNPAASIGSSSMPTISGDGRYIAFYATVSNLVPDDSNGVGDIFVYDQQTGQRFLASVDTAGNQANGVSQSPALTANGTAVVYISAATNLVPDDSNGQIDVFEHSWGN